MDSAQQTIITDLGPLRMTRAQADDLDAVMGILENATAWLEARGIDQWHDDPRLRTRIASRIERGEMWLARLGQEAIGTLALQWADEEMWSARPPDAGYVHGLAVRRAYAGHGVGRALLDWAAGEVARAGRKFLRLDCVAHNGALRAYYEAAGFVYRGDRAYADEGGASSLFERAVGVRGTINVESSGVMFGPSRVQTQAGTLDVRLARTDDVPAVVALYRETTDWIRAQGFDPGEAPRPLAEIVAERVGTGTVYIALLGGEVVATMTVLREDVEMWGERPNDALYLHGFGVKRAYAGQRIGLALLDWLAKMARGAGREYVRLDCEAGNRKLRDYYEHAGFAYRGDVTTPSHTGSRYERAVRAA
jgi:GNAT superfamily N-acetyltransferase